LESDMSKYDEAKEAWKKINDSLSSEEKKILADYLKGFLKADDDEKFEGVVDPLDRSYLEMKLDEEKLKKQAEVLKALMKVGEIAIKLAIAAASA
jgi:hypothetical protein